VLWCLYAKFHLIAIDTKDRNFEVIPDFYGFIFFAS
jgi:hypothetical protein